MTDRARNSIILLVVIAALIAAILAAVFKSPVLGLDLQGGTEVTLLAKPEKGQTINADQLDQSVSIIRNRVDKLGVSEPEIRKESGNRIVVMMTGERKGQDRDRRCVYNTKTNEAQFDDQ